MKELQIEQRGSVWVGVFRAMASPCEIHIELRSRKRAAQLMALAQKEALRIERLFSRYRDDNVIHRINTAAGRSVTVDSETARMLDFADQCFTLSEGLFDVTSGLLRKAWNFDGSDRVPTMAAVDALLPQVGWQQVSWSEPHFTLPDGMQIDLGGIGKEYAVDRTVSLLNEHCQAPFLVNFGGDLHALRSPVTAQGWRVGIEASRGGSSDALHSILLERGALTTSGDARRYLLKDGVRYGHVLNPKTGWPVEGAPASVTVAGNTCTEAGILSTLAILHGNEAESFLEDQGVRYWVQR
ncbi:FAD:protein FMN transferase [Granulosicoccus antarcticus]|uniref:FAD:protein FMN transferase n=1 Tax=Granulosicoccus antarcticus IMCC3135 TaxID=1192854 RepID=A0A2Z2NJ45_9GAMM|nr:FAD:protein FMN transferase [Granulosicoccus antarcticus]ASJ71189.1 FAD:protein FMN transferase [Granulosicoccus antarcticus IMCC3135]